MTNEVKDTGRPYVYVVTYQDVAKEPVITVFNNEEAANKCYMAFVLEHDNAWIDSAPIYSRFCKGR